MSNPGDSIKERCRAARSTFLRQLEAPEQLQSNVLSQCLTLNRDTVFGREHGFSEIRSVEEFRRRVPLRSYDEFWPYIEREASGESGVLCQEPPLLFFTSSGSTGTHKKLPVTVPFLKHSYVPFVQATLGNFFHFFPETAERADATINFKWDPHLDLGSTASGKPYLGASQVDYKKLLGEELAAEPGTRAPWAAPGRDIADPVDRLYYRVCWSANADLRAIVGINPAILAAVIDLLPSWAPRLIQELKDGTVLGHPVKPPDVARATWLERCIETSGTLLPVHLWPKLEAVFCWTGAVAHSYLPGLRAALGPGVSIVTAPIAASEAPIGVPIDRHSALGVLALPHTFLEFVDVDREVRAATRTLGFSELKAGGLYKVVLTQCAGLSRYALGDVVRVGDFHGSVPRVEFIGRDSLTPHPSGALGEWTLLDVVRRATHDIGVELKNFRFCFAEPESAEQPTQQSLQLCVEPRAVWRADEAELLAARVHSLLLAAWQRDRPKAALPVAAPCVTIRVVPSGAFTEDWVRRVRSGVRPAQAKDRVVERSMDAWKALCSSP